MDKYINKIYDYREVHLDTLDGILCSTKGKDLRKTYEKVFWGCYIKFTMIPG